MKKIIYNTYLTSIIKTMFIRDLRFTENFIYSGIFFSNYQLTNKLNFERKINEKPKKNENTLPKKQHFSKKLMNLPVK